MLQRITRRLPARWTAERGEDLVEYGLLASLISIAAMLTIGIFAGTLLGVWQGIAGRLAAAL